MTARAPRKPIQVRLSEDGLKELDRVAAAFEHNRSLTIRVLLARGVADWDREQRAKEPKV